MHDNVMSILGTLKHQHTISGPVLEIGSININGSARQVFGELFPYVGVDIVAGPNVDLVVDITKPNFVRSHYPKLMYDFKTIICTEVLEHTPPEYLIPAMMQFISRETAIIITCAGPGRKPHSANGAPNVKPGEYYQNVDPLQLSELLYLVDDPTISIERVSVWTSMDNTDVYAFAQYRKTS
jgi:hypothetical protein